MAELAVVATLEGAFEETVTQSAVEHLRERASEAGSDRAVRIDRFVESLQDRGGPSRRAWAQELEQAFSFIDSERLNVWLADNCILSALMQEDVLTSGPPLRRLDAVLDIADAPFCARDVQEAFAEFATSLAEAKLTWVHAAGATGLSAAAGFTGGFFFMPFIGTLGTKASEYLLGQSSRVDETSEQAARLLVAATAASSGVDSGPDLTLSIWQSVYDATVEAGNRLSRQRSRSANTYTGVGASADQRVRVVSTAQSYLRDMLMDRWSVSTEVATPNVVGLPLSLAEELLASLGIRTWRDVPDGRSIMVAGNWFVDGQDEGDHGLSRHVTLRVGHY